MNLKSLSPLAAAATTVALIGAATGSAVASTIVLSKVDRTGDVVLAKAKAPISNTKRKSIDVEKTSVTRLDNGQYRFAVRMKKVYTSSKWDQMINFEATGAGWGDVSIWFKTRSSGGAYAYDSETEDGCDLKVVRGDRTVRVDVPARCAPIEGQEVRLRTYTGHYQTDANPFSRDYVYMGKFRE